MSGGTLAAASTTAFGNGDVYVGSGGGVKIAANAPVTIATRYTQLDNTTLELDIDGNGGGRLRVGGPLTVTGGTLRVKFVNGYTPKAGDTIALIDGGGRREVLDGDGRRVQGHAGLYRDGRVGHAVGGVARSGHRSW